MVEWGNRTQGFHQYLEGVIKATVRSPLILPSLLQPLLLSQLLLKRKFMSEETNRELNLTHKLIQNICDYANLNQGNKSLLFFFAMRFIAKVM